MKRSSFLIVAFMAMALFFTNDLSAQKFSGLDKSPADIVYLRTSRSAPPIAKVVYSRPQKKGRDIFGGLVAYDKVWRTGANEATEVTFYQDVKVGDANVKAGTYSLFSIPGKSQWTIILNSGLHQWGAYQHDASKDVAKITVDAGSDSDSLEAFSIAFKRAGDGAEMVLGWDTTRVAIPISM